MRAAPAILALALIGGLSAVPVIAQADVPAIVVNEVESNGDATDWIEFMNVGTEPVDLSGYIVKDDNDSRTLAVPAGTIVEPGGFYAIDTDDESLADGFGLGKGDSARLFLPDGTTLVDGYTWPNNHAAVTYGRCHDGTGEFVDTVTSTKGAQNLCPAAEVAPVVINANDCEPAADHTPWPGSPETAVQDTEIMFIQDSSGLDFAMEGDRGVLWAVDNGTGTFWKLDAAPDGSVAFAEGWESGKRARFAKDGDDPAAAGPDTEGITMAGDGYLYIASERDNADKGVNFNSILKVDPTAAGPDVVATQEWDLTASLPQVSANTGIEAVEWVSDAELAGALWDATTGAPYDPTTHPGHGDGLFFVAVEDNGGVYAYALHADGSSTQVASLDPQLGGVMALDWDAELGLLWALCDDGCSGTGAQITLDGTQAAAVAHLARPEGLPNTNNEGFATSTLCVDGQRPVWWFTDGVQPGALRSGFLPCNEQVEPTPEPSEEPTVAPTSPAPTVAPTTPVPTSPVDDGDDADEPHDPGTTAPAHPRPSRPGLPSTGC